MTAISTRKRLRSAGDCLLALVALAATSGSGVQTEASFSADAAWLYRHAELAHVVLSPEGGALTLERGVLIEDDGPAAGYSYKPNRETLKDGLRIRKDLVVPRAAADRAALLVNPGGRLALELNGSDCPLRALEKAAPAWEQYAIDPALLQNGTNRFVISGTGSLWIARDDEHAAGAEPGLAPPNRSARSTDGGKTWDAARLGDGADVDGEYAVRLFLDQYVPEGSVRLPVLDLGNLGKNPVAPPLRSVVRAKIQAAVSGGDAELNIRSGETAFVDDRSWTGWTELGTDGFLENSAGRYVQVEARLASTDARQSPRLERITVRSWMERGPDWTGRLSVVTSNNAPIIRSSVPFQYEPFNHPRLKALRRERKLDDVVAGASSEFDLILKLAAWTSARSGLGLQGGYPPWDALEILRREVPDPGAFGYCQMYAIVFLQACESFGLCGRAVSLSPGGEKSGGHEVAELWSNDYGKWVYVDAQMAGYAVDAATDVPLSLLDLHERQRAVLAGAEARPTRIVMLPGVERRTEWGDLTDWPPFGELRLIPRSNFLEARAPLPLNQGMRGWSWTGHVVWEDSEPVSSPIYSKRLRRRQDFDWDLNRTHLVFEAGAEPGLLTVHSDTHTPGFDTFMASFDGGAARRVQPPFPWRMHGGTNALRVVSVNRTGRDGVPASVEVQWNP